MIYVYPANTFGILKVNHGDNNAQGVIVLYKQKQDFIIPDALKISGNMDLIDKTESGNCYNSFCDNNACDCDPCECTEFSPCVCCDFDDEAIVTL